MTESHNKLQDDKCTSRKLSEWFMRDDYCSVCEKDHLSMYGHADDCLVPEIAMLEDSRVSLTAELSEANRLLLAAAFKYLELGEENASLTEKAERLTHVHKDWDLDHAYWCDSTHGTGLPCDCDFDEWYALLERSE